MKRPNTCRKLYCSRSTQTYDNSDDESEDSDFPPCLEGKSPPLMSRSPVPTHSSRYLRAPAANSSQHQLTISSEKKPHQSSQRHRQLNTGLGQTNIINTVDATTKVFLHYLVHIVAMLMLNVSVNVPRQRSETLRMNTLRRNSILLPLTMTIWHAFNVTLQKLRRLSQRWLLRQGRTDNILPMHSKKLILVVVR